MKKHENKINKKILESKRIIKEEKKKIKLEKKIIRDKKIKKTKFYKFFQRTKILFKEEKETYSFSELFSVSIFSLIVGMIACFLLLFVLTGGRNYFKLSKNLGKFFDVYDTLVDNYYDDVDIKELEEAAIDGMVSSVGDYYTNYIDTDNSSEFDELVNGTYEGIGCMIQMQETGLIVIEVFEGSPSEKAGLMVGDKILKVDDKEITKDTNIEELSDYIKTKNDKKVIMVISRDNEEKTLELIREKVETPVVSSEVYENNGKKIGYVNISLFSSVASSQFEKKLIELEKQGIDGLIIDVRNNTGGYLTSVKDIASQLLPKGKVIYQVEKDEKREVTKDRTKECTKYPIAVIINGVSASASEILAAAIKESYGHGYVVGVKSYGKGTVQQVKKLSDGSMIKYTVENWLTPLGNWIDGKGVEPTNEVLLSEEYYKNPVVENDNQLNAALGLVSK